MLSQGYWSLMIGADSGELAFDNENTLRYKVSFVRTFSWMLIVTICAGIATLNILIPITIAMVLIVPNWIIWIIRHYYFFQTLVLIAKEKR